MSKPALTINEPTATGWLRMELYGDRDKAQDYTHMAVYLSLSAYLAVTSMREDSTRRMVLAGVMAGLLLGLLGTWVGRQLLSSAVAVQLPLLVIAVVVSLLAGGMACLAPAMVAARLEPAAALRS